MFEPMSGLRRVGEERISYHCPKSNYDCSIFQPASKLLRCNIPPPRVIQKCHFSTEIVQRLATYFILHRGRRLWWFASVLTFFHLCHLDYLFPPEATLFLHLIISFHPETPASWLYEFSTRYASSTT